MRLLLIGGHDVICENDIIEKFIVNYKYNPNILFVTAASKDSLKSKMKLEALFNKYICNISFLLLYSNPNNISDLLEWADIIYFDGGDTRLLVSKIKEYNIDSYLKNTNKLLVGISAGMNMMGRYSVGDIDSYEDNFHTYNYKMVEGIGLINYCLCPHYNLGDRDFFNSIPKKYNMSGLALENDTAIYIHDDYFNVIKAKKNRSVYIFKKESDYVMESIYYKKSIAVLGPEGTFCDVACKAYLKEFNLPYDITYYPNIKSVCEGINDTGIGILPFENSIDGYVLETIDTLIKNNYKIIYELNADVEFAFVSNAKKIEDVKNVFVQFKAKQECLEFLTIKNHFNLIITDSNIMSLNNLLNSDDTFGAIIPLHKAMDYNFNICINNLSDVSNNSTRFVVVAKDIVPNLDSDIKCSLCLFMNEDYPGILFDALKLFNEYKVNLNAIMSRPTKEALGKYNFYIEISSKKDEINNIMNAIKAIESDNRYEIKNLGIYSK